MKSIIVTSHSASKILYNFLKANKDLFEGLWMLPSNVCECIPDTFREAGIEFDFVDIEFNSLCIRMDDVIRRAGEIAGVFYVHTYGVEYTPINFFENLKRLNPQICIIDDRCLCQPRFDFPYDIADMELYSTNAKKQVNLGGGGIRG